MLRTLLFAPGSNEERARKALNTNSDAVILDLEDAVAPAEKPRARQVICQLLREVVRDRVYVRVNQLSSPFAFADLREIVGNGPAGVILPKAESKREVEIVDWLMGQVELEAGIPVGQTDLIPLVESAQGIENALEIAQASTRVKRLAFGALDYTADLGTAYTKTGEETFYARSRLVVASRAAGKEGPIDTVFPDVKDTEGLTQETELIKGLGFQGKLVIHPGQIVPVQQVFTPTEAEIAKAQRVLEAYREAAEKGLGVIQLDGKMIDPPVIKRAEQILELAGLN